ncbi:hypothetical protein ANN_02439 [Periplaneta americana]|uniref:Odorant receptor n=1 Tax=Periplaneta americana TaxID=6978 RepID=A0ABQ8TWC9_PERAM|nr:hypothetical protein ANN_02439 [Periplaneta americana]
MIGIGFIFYTDLGPIITAGYEEVENTSNSSLSNQTSYLYKMRLPVETWFPFDTSQSPGFEIAYFSLTVMCQIEGVNMIATDVMFITIIIYITGQFELLSDALTNMSNNVKLRMMEEGRLYYEEGTKGAAHQQDVEETAADETPPPSPQTDHLELISKEKWEQSIEIPSNLKTNIFREEEIYIMECIRHHQSLIESSRRLSELWKTIFFVQCITASILICFIGFEAMMVPLDSTFVTMMIFLTCCVFQLALYCMFGSNLMTQSEEVHNAAYNSDWYGYSDSVKISIKMIIMRAQRPMQITAGKFGTVSWPLFASVSKTIQTSIKIFK